MFEEFNGEMLWYAIVVFKAPGSGSLNFNIRDDGAAVGSLTTTPFTVRFAASNTRIEALNKDFITNHAADLGTSAGLTNYPGGNFRGQGTRDNPLQIPVAYSRNSPNIAPTRPYEYLPGTEAIISIHDLFGLEGGGAGGGHPTAANMIMASSVRNRGSVDGIMPMYTQSTPDTFNARDASLWKDGEYQPAQFRRARMASVEVRTADASFVQVVSGHQIDGLPNQNTIGTATSGTQTPHHQVSNSAFDGTLYQEFLMNRNVPFEANHRGRGNPPATAEILSNTAGGIGRGTNASGQVSNTVRAEDFTHFSGVVLRGRQRSSRPIELIFYVYINGGSGYYEFENINDNAQNEGDEVYRLMEFALSVWVEVVNSPPVFMAPNEDMSIATIEGGIHRDTYFADTNKFPFNDIFVGVDGRLNGGNNDMMSVSLGKTLGTRATYIEGNQFVEGPSYLFDFTKANTAGGIISVLPPSGTQQRSAMVSLPIRDDDPEDNLRISFNSINSVFYGGLGTFPAQAATGGINVLGTEMGDHRTNLSGLPASGIQGQSFGKQQSTVLGHFSNVEQNFWYNNLNYRPGGFNQSQATGQFNQAFSYRDFFDVEGSRGFSHLGAVNGITTYEDPTMLTVFPRQPTTRLRFCDNGYCSHGNIGRLQPSPLPNIPCSGNLNDGFFPLYFVVYDEPRNAPSPFRVPATLGARTCDIPTCAHLSENASCPRNSLEYYDKTFTHSHSGQGTHTYHTYHDPIVSGGTLRPDGTAASADEQAEFNRLVGRTIVCVRVYISASPTVPRRSEFFYRMNYGETRNDITLTSLFENADFQRRGENFWDVNRPDDPLNVLGGLGSGQGQISDAFDTIANLGLMNAEGTQALWSDAAAGAVCPTSGIVNSFYGNANGHLDVRMPTFYKWDPIPNGTGIGDSPPPFPGATVNGVPFGPMEYDSYLRAYYEQFYGTTTQRLSITARRPVFDFGIQRILPTDTPEVARQKQDANIANRSFSFYLTVENQANLGAHAFLPNTPEALAFAYCAIKITVMITNQAPSPNRIPSEPINITLYVDDELTLQTYRLMTDGALPGDPHLVNTGTTSEVPSATGRGTVHVATSNRLSFFNTQAYVQYEAAERALGASGRPIGLPRGNYQTPLAGFSVPNPQSGQGQPLNLTGFDALALLNQLHFPDTTVLETTRTSEMRWDEMLQRDVEVWVDVPTGNARRISQVEQLMESALGEYLRFDEGNVAEFSSLPGAGAQQAALGGSGVANLGPMQIRVTALRPTPIGTTLTLRLNVADAASENFITTVEYNITVTKRPPVIRPHVAENTIGITSNTNVATDISLSDYIVSDLDRSGNNRAGVSIQNRPVHEDRNGLVKTVFRNNVTINSLFIGDSDFVITNDDGALVNADENSYFRFSVSGGVLRITPLRAMNRQADNAPVTTVMFYVRDIADNGVLVTLNVMPVYDTLAVRSTHRDLGEMSGGVHHLNAVAVNGGNSEFDLGAVLGSGSRMRPDSFFVSSENINERDWLGSEYEVLVYEGAVTGVRQNVIQGENAGAVDANQTRGQQIEEIMWNLERDGQGRTIRDTNLNARRLNQRTPVAHYQAFGGARAYTHTGFSQTGTHREYLEMPETSGIEFAFTPNTARKVIRFNSLKRNDSLPMTIVVRKHVWSINNVSMENVPHNFNFGVPVQSFSEVRLIVRFNIPNSAPEATEHIPQMQTNFISPINLRVQLDENAEPQYTRTERFGDVNAENGAWFIDRDGSAPEGIIGNFGYLPLNLDTDFGGGRGWKIACVDTSCCNMLSRLPELERPRYNNLHFRYAEAFRESLMVSVPVTINGETNNGRFIQFGARSKIQKDANDNDSATTTDRSFVTLYVRLYVSDGTDTMGRGNIPPAFIPITISNSPPEFANHTLVEGVARFDYGVRAGELVTYAGQTGNTSDMPMSAWITDDDFSESNFYYYPNPPRLPGIEAFTVTSSNFPGITLGALSEDGFIITRGGVAGADRIAVLRAEPHFRTNAEGVEEQVFINVPGNPTPQPAWKSFSIEGLSTRRGEVSADIRISIWDTTGIAATVAGTAVQEAVLSFRVLNSAPVAEANPDTFVLMGSTVAQRASSMVIFLNERDHVAYYSDRANNPGFDPDDPENTMPKFTHLFRDVNGACRLETCPACSATPRLACGDEARFSSMANIQIMGNEVFRVSLAMMTGVYLNRAFRVTALMNMDDPDNVSLRSGVESISLTIFDGDPLLPDTMTTAVPIVITVRIVEDPREMTRISTICPGGVGALTRTTLTIGGLPVERDVSHCPHSKRMLDDTRPAGTPESEMPLTVCDGGERIPDTARLVDGSENGRTVNIARRFSVPNRRTFIPRLDDRVPGGTPANAIFFSSFTTGMTLKSTGFKVHRFIPESAQAGVRTDDIIEIRQNEAGQDYIYAKNRGMAFVEVFVEIAGLEGELFSIFILITVTENRPPVLILQNAELRWFRRDMAFADARQRGAGTFSVEIGALFSDPEGDEMRFVSVKSDDPATVNVTLGAPGQNDLVQRLDFSVRYRGRTLITGEVADAYSIVQFEFTFINEDMGTMGFFRRISNWISLNTMTFIIWVSAIVGGLVLIIMFAKISKARRLRRAEIEAQMVDETNMEDALLQLQAANDMQLQQLGMMDYGYMQLQQSGMGYNNMQIGATGAPMFDPSMQLGMGGMGGAAAAPDALQLGVGQSDTGFDSSYGGGDGFGGGYDAGGYDAGGYDAGGGFDNFDSGLGGDDYGGGGFGY
jgi:hypothetical protein